MNIVSLIEKKVQGYAYSREEIFFIIHGFVQQTITDYQMASWLMAVRLKGMDANETALLTEAMVASGQTIDLSSIQGAKVDKHSTGGVGDKTSLIIGPLAAACGLKVAKMSGRGLGHTGGTIDKLESIPGFNTSLSTKQFLKQVETIGVSIVGQTGELVPADKKMYALRDVTATVASLPLIASSIMSKKIASGADIIVLDVKYGSGAFMKTLDDARLLAQAMVSIGQKLGKKTRALLSNMHAPLGYAIGNENEVEEAILTLKGLGPKTLTSLCIDTVAHMLVLNEPTLDYSRAYQTVEALLHNGKAYEVFQQFVEAQGGSLQAFVAKRKLRPLHHHIIHSSTSGFIEQIDAFTLGTAAVELGAGRHTKDDMIDPKAGIDLKKHIADAVNKDEPLAILSSHHPISSEVIAAVTRAFTIGDHPMTTPPLIAEVVA